MNRGNEDIKSGLIRMANDPMATRNTVRILMEAVGALERLEEELDAAEAELQKAISALTKKNPEAGEGGFTSPKQTQPTTHTTTPKRGRPAKSRDSVHQENKPKRML